MARARNIKPGFFKNEVLAELSLGTRLIFIGLWCLADREGRLEDRPKRIKLELLPFDDFDVSLALDELEGHGFIHRYTVEGVSIIQVVNFAKHQSPHGTERDSELPDQNGCLTVNQRGKNGYITNIEQVGNSSLTVKKRVPNALNPDSLIPDSLIPEYPQTPKGAEREVEPKKPGAKLPKGFEVFWAAYPRKEGKLAAAKAFAKAVKLVEHPHPTEALTEAALAFAKACAGKDPQYIAHPTTWLNQGRWADAPTTPTDPRQQALASGMWNGRPLTPTERYMLENNPSYLPMAAGGG
jgi:hypothetical protein